MKVFISKLLSWKILLIVLLILISYGQTLQMYFWQDDSALIFKLQNPEGMAGSFGYGIIGYGAYKYLVTFFVPFFPFFGREPFGYFFVGFVTYFIATYFFYRFVRVLFEENKYAYYATLIFSAGYIGSDIMFRVINSWQTNLGLILAFLTFEQLAKFIKNKKYTHYLLGIFFYWAATEFVFIRSHSLIVPILILDALFLVDFSKINSVIRYFFRQVPFVIIFYFRYLTDEGFGGPGLVDLLKELIAGKFEVLSTLFANIGNSVFAYPIQVRILQPVLSSVLTDQEFIVSAVAFGLFSFFYLTITADISRMKKIAGVGLLLIGFVINIYFYSLDVLWYRGTANIFSGAIGIELLILILLVSVQNWRTKKTISKNTFFALIFIATQVFGYYVQYPTSIWETTHRYFSYVLIGFSIMVASVINIIDARKNEKGILGKFILIGILFIHLYLGFKYQYRLVETRSKSTRDFYTRLTTYVPKIEKGAGFYFDISQISPYPQYFSDFFSVGSMPESTALAMYYNVDRYDVQFLTDFDEVIAQIVSGELKIDNLYSFYYGNEGLIDNTSEMRTLLEKGSETKSYKSFVDITTHSLVPVELTFSMSAKKGNRPSEFSTNDYSLEEKMQLLKYLKSRNDYYENVTVKSNSDWRYREVRNVVDNNITTEWQGHRIYWNQNEHEELMVDLGRVKEIGSVVWTNWKTALAPISYSIETSMDNNSWTVQKSVNDGSERRNDEQVVEKFPPVEARYVRMVINKTQTNDSPSLLEFEVVEQEYIDVSFSDALMYYENPLSLASNEAEWDRLYELASALSFATVTWKSDKGDVYNQSAKIPIIIDGKNRNYSVVVPAGGTLIGDVDINYSLPISAEINSISTRSFSLHDIVNNNLVVNYTEN